MQAFSILVATRNRHSCLERMLRSLSQCHVEEGLRLDMVVADNGSTDGTAPFLAAYQPPPWLKFRAMTVLERGKPRALNAAIPTLEGDVVLFTDDNVIFPEDWVMETIRPFREFAGKVDVSQGRILNAPAFLEEWHRRYPYSDEWDVPPMDEGETPAWGRPHTVGANMAITRAALRDVDGFHPLLLYWNDVEIGNRLHAKQKRFYYNPRSLVLHHPPVAWSIKSHIRKQFAKGRHYPASEVEPFVRPFMGSRGLRVLGGGALKLMASAGGLVRGDKTRAVREVGAASSRAGAVWSLWFDPKLGKPRPL